MPICDNKLFRFAKVVTMVALALGWGRLEVSGHTDNIPISTLRFPSNLGAVVGSASRVARYVIENGIDPSRIGRPGHASKTASSGTPEKRRTTVELQSAIANRLYRDSDENPIP